MVFINLNDYHNNMEILVISIYYYWNPVVTMAISLGNLEYPVL